jgi:enoyl-CoA hydratase
MEKNTVTYETKEGIGIISLNRPRQMNALSIEMVEEFSSLLDRISTDDGTRVIIIAGTNKFFSVGADISEILKVDSPTAAYSFFNKIKSLFNKVEDYGKPIISAVAGYALGGGCELAMACDLRIAAQNAKFGLPEVKLGIIPGGGGTQRLVRILGVTKAKELLYTGDHMDAKEAFERGLVNRVVAVEGLLEEARKLAARISRNPSFALKMAKHAIHAGSNMDIKSAMEYEARCVEILFSTKDLKEGISAFVAKREPKFTGE